MGEKEEKRTITEDIFEKMQKMIVSGAWPPGEKIPSEKELMSLFHASRISIREPLKQLVSLGLVETRRGSGTVVRNFNEESFIAPMRSTYTQSLTKQDVLSILELRQIEVTIAGISAERATEAEVESLRRIQKNFLSEDSFIQQQTDLEFHLQICRMTKNLFFLQVCSLLYQVLEKALVSIVPIMGPQRAIYYHTKLIDTISHHYIYEARAAMEEHLATTVEAVKMIPADADFFARF